MNSQTLDLLTFNLNNPSRERAERQLVYLLARPETVLVLTETADSAGCDLLESRFRMEGYDVTFPRPGRGERGVMIVSRLATVPGRVVAHYLPHRAVTVKVDTQEGAVDVVGLYVPSRDATAAKRARKEKFLEGCRAGLPGGNDGSRVVLGDFNILEPDHFPPYRFFKAFEYGFYDWLCEVGYHDAYRELHPNSLEYSWVGRTGDGYRYDHAHVSASLRPALRNCSYVHGPRTREDRLTDHSALTMSLALHPKGALREAESPTFRENAAPHFPVPTRPEEFPVEDTTWPRIEMLRTWLDENAAPVGDERLWRILKISEEVGEVAEAMHGAAGTNPRKGHSHTWDDVTKELCDVIVTSMVALSTCTPDAAKLLDERLQHLVDRVLPS
ncbi:endonuclease/exonuclease/phosphatase [Streptomyces niveus]|uniref:endonuclease/exonuclease/phosphatase n=1 Tax=Streptomyces niveus TaxID=193462 RepID=UPI0036918EF2